MLPVAKGLGVTVKEKKSKARSNVFGILCTSPAHQSVCSVTLKATLVLLV